MSTILIILTWCITGLTTVPWVIGWMNRRGDSMIRDPAAEALLGLTFGPIPLAMFAAYLVLRTAGRITWRITRQSHTMSTKPRPQTHQTEAPMSTVIQPGTYRVTSPVGELHVDTQLNAEQLAAIVHAMQRHDVLPAQITEATITAQGSVTLRGYELDADGRHRINSEGELVEREWA